METKLERISKLAENDSDLKFTSLAHLLDEKNLKKCYRELGKNKAPGVDGETWEEYGKDLDGNISDLVDRLKAKKYWPKPVKRTYIPKEGKDEQRPIGIPALEDKIIQLGISKILTAIYEADFLDISFGFRPERSPHDALRELNKSIMVRKTNWVLDADIKGFFDHVDHEWMMKFLRERIKDTTLLKLILRFLKAGVMGTPFRSEPEGDIEEISFVNCGKYLRDPQLYYLVLKCRYAYRPLLVLTFLGNVGTFDRLGPVLLGFEPIY